MSAYRLIARQRNLHHFCVSVRRQTSVFVQHNLVAGGIIGALAVCFCGLLGSYIIKNPLKAKQLAMYAS